MNMIRKLILLAALGLSPCLLAEESTPKVLETPEQVAEFINKAQAIPSKGDEFMGFLLEKAKTYTGKAEQTIGQAVDLAIKEAGPTAEEFLRWRFWMHVVKGGSPAIVCLMIFIMTAIFVPMAVKNGWNDAWPSAPAFIGCFLCIATIPIFFECVVPHLISAIQIHIAPRIYLIEELGKLIK